MTDMPIVSVVVPVYNTEKFLSKCIESILKQTYKKIELVLVDDYSTDSSGEICEQYANLDKRVKYIRQNKNGGVCKARNTGIKSSVGRYICFIDADDFIVENFIEQFVSIIKEKKVPVIYGQLKYYQDGKYLSRPRRIKEGLYETEAVSSILVDDGTVTGILFGSVCGAIYDLDFIKSERLCFDENLKRNEDGLFNLDLLALGNRFYVTYYDGYCYRQWKDEIGEPCFEPDEELNKATEAIRRRHSHLDEINLQIQRRNVSVIFWNAIRIGRCKESAEVSCKRLAEYIENSSIDRDYSAIKNDVMNKYKKILIFMLYKRWIIIFYFIMRFVYPLIKNYR